MKTTLLTLLSCLTLALSASAALIQHGTFNFSYDFLDGGRLEGTFNGYITDEEPGYAFLDESDYEASGTYYHPDGVTTYTRSYEFYGSFGMRADGDATPSVLIPTGVVLWVFNGPYGSPTEELFLVGDVRLLYDVNGSPVEFTETFRPEAWSLTHNIVTDTPDGGSTAALLGAGVLGMAAAKRLRHGARK